MLCRHKVKDISPPQNMSGDPQGEGTVWWSRYTALMLTQKGLLHTSKFTQGIDME